MKWLITALLAASVGAFAPAALHTSTASQTSQTSSAFSSALAAKLTDGDQVMLIGPGFLQCVVAKTCKAAGLRPLICAPQTKLDNFEDLVGDATIMSDATIGMPEVGEDQFGNISAIVFCAEDAVLPASFIRRVLDYQDKGQSAFVEGGLKKVILCAPLTGQEKQEKSMGWIPIFNNDDKKEKIWDDFVNSYEGHPMYEKDEASLVRFGSLLGGSTDGPECLRELGINEKMYKMSLEQYRDLKERAFDRYRLGAQVLKGNAVNKMPPNQEKMEKEALKTDALKETFTVVDGYPEQERTNRHTVAQAVVQSLLRDDGAYPKEMTVLSTAMAQFPGDSEWDALFANPGPAKWPDPFKFEPAKWGVETEA